MFSYTVHLPTVSILFLEHAWRLSNSFLPRARAISILALPCSVDENQNRDDGKTHILGSGLEMTYLALLEQKFAVAPLAS